MSSYTHDHELADLTLHLNEWRATGKAPESVGVLPTGHYRALMLAVGRDNEMRTPVLDFLLLDGWLQKWVLQSWGKPSLIGQVLGD